MNENEIPQIEHLLTRYGSDGVKGWPELDLWANRNIPLWNAVSANAHSTNATEETRLKLLCYFLLKQCEEQKAQLIKIAQEQGPSLIIPH